MQHRPRLQLSYANVMSTLAVFLVLGGSAAWAASKITTKNIATGAVTGKKIAKETIKSANLKDGVAVTGADVAAGSLPVDRLPADEELHVVGDPGEPQFRNGGQGDCIWRDGGGPGVNPVGFRIDRFGTVHLTGVAQAVDGGAGPDGICGTPLPIGDEVEDGLILTLPPAYRPANGEVRVRNTGASVLIAGTQALGFGTGVIPPGTIFTQGGATTALLDGIEFPAASAALIPTTRRPGADRLNRATARALGF